MINSYGRIIILLLLFVLMFTLLPFLAGTGRIVSRIEYDFSDEGDLAIIKDILFSRDRIPVHDLSIRLALGMSIFALFVICLGGYSKHRRFNDRAIDGDFVMKDVIKSLMAAHEWAVFNFPNSWKDLTRDAVNFAFLPTFQSNGGTTP
jgi:hypothetical protein